MSTNAPLTLCMLDNFSWFFQTSEDIFQQYFFSKYSFRNNIRVSDSLDSDPAWSRSKLFAKIISRWQNSPLAGIEIDSNNIIIMHKAYFPVQNKASFQYISYSSCSSKFQILLLLTSFRERSGSVVECLTRDRRAAGSSLTSVTALWSLSKTHLS